MEASEAKPSEDTAAAETIDKTEEITSAVKSEAAPTAGESVETSDDASEATVDSTDSTPSEENSDSTESADQEADETPEIKVKPLLTKISLVTSCFCLLLRSIQFFFFFCLQLETAPADFRFPTTNQTRHCFTRYIEYHRWVN